MIQWWQRFVLVTTGFALFATAGPARSDEPTPASEAVLAVRGLRDKVAEFSDASAGARSTPPPNDVAWAAARDARIATLLAFRDAERKLSRAATAGLAGNGTGEETTKILRDILDSERHLFESASKRMPPQPAPTPPPEPFPISTEPTGGFSPGWLAQLKAFATIMDAQHAEFESLYGYYQFNKTTARAGERVGIPNVRSGGNWLWYDTREAVGPSHRSVARLRSFIASIEREAAPLEAAVAYSYAVKRYAEHWGAQWDVLVSVMDELVDVFVIQHTQGVASPLHEARAEALKAKARGALTDELIPFDPSNMETFTSWRPKPAQDPAVLETDEAKELLPYVQARARAYAHYEEAKRRLDEAYDAKMALESKVIWADREGDVPESLLVQYRAAQRAFITRFREEDLALSQRDYAGRDYVDARHRIGTRSAVERLRKEAAGALPEIAARLLAQAAALEQWLAEREARNAPR